MRYSNEQSIKEVIKEMIDLYHLAPKLNERKLVASWEKVVGKMIARHTTGVFVKNKTVYIELNSAALRSELSLAKTKLVKSINKEIGSDAVQEIVFL